MAYTLKPTEELARYLPPRATSIITGWPAGIPKLPSPGAKARLAAALKNIASRLETQARREIGCTEADPIKEDRGVTFRLMPRDEQWVIDDEVAAVRLPREKNPEAWKISKSWRQRQYQSRPPSRGELVRMQITCKQISCGERLLAVLTPY